ncbi:MAG: ATP-binding protein [Bacteroidales bacterium]
MKIQRLILKDLRDHLSRKEITLITGPRQAGKTTLMKELIGEINRAGKRTLFLDLDFEPDKIHLESQNALIDRIRLEFGDSPGTVFIDEIQRKINSGIFLKGLYDRDLPIKFVITGSGSLELKEKIHESLFGRKRIFEVLPVSFLELADYQTEYRYSTKLEEFFRLEPEGYSRMLKSYLDYGGYPKVVLEATHQERLNQVNEIYSSYINRDIVSLLGLDQPDAFSRMIRFLAAHTGRLTDFAEIARATGISVPTVKKYIWYAEKTYILKVVTPYHTNKVKEITKSPVYYFTDLGFRNFILGEFGNASSTSDAGFLFQNLVFLELLCLAGHHAWNVHYWRTADGAEVDFVLDRKNSLLPVEVKYSTLSAPLITRSMRSFIEKYRPSEAWVVSPVYRNEIMINDCQVKFIPFSTLAHQHISKWRT